MKLSKKLTTTLTTIGTVLSLGAVACADNVIMAKPGDTLSSIANESHTTIVQLQNNNNIQNPNEIKVGQKIKVGSTESKDNYVIVKDGDTLSQIALENGTTVAKLQELNHLSNVNEILPGQKILLDAYLKSNSNFSLPANSDQDSQNQAVIKNDSSNTNSLANQNMNNAKNYIPQQVQQNTANTGQKTAQGISNIGNGKENTYQISQNNANYQNATSINNDSKATPVNSSNMDSNNSEAKAWIAQHESGGNYNATNGQYIGKYQLSSSYLNGDYSPANQERCADQYVNNRYGNWVNAQQHWMTYGWY